MDCMVCKESSSEILYSALTDRYYPEISGIYKVKQCKQCGLMFIDPQPSQEKLTAHYPERYPVYQRKLSEVSRLRVLITKLVAQQYLGYGKPKWWRFILLPFFKKLSHLPTHVKNGSILDIGCATGTRLQTFHMMGWNTKGVEMSQQAAKIAQDAGYDVLFTPIEQAELPEKYFDVVYLNNVFEHIRDPHAALEKIKKVLNPGGEIILVIPNGSGLAARLFRQFWFGLEVPRHLFTFNKASISKLIEQYGFSIKKIIYTHTFGSISSSLAYWLGKSAETFLFLERPVYVLNFVFDPLVNFLGIGD